MEDFIKRFWSLSWFLLGIGGLISCGGGASDSYVLVIKLRTDLVAGEEFDHAQIFITRADGEDGGRQIELEVGRQSFLPGSRLAELNELAPGNYRIDVELEDRVRGRLIAKRPLLVEVRGNLVATVPIDRSCLNVACPPRDDPSTPEDESTYLACLGAQCVNPKCSLETPEFCGGPSSCESDDACVVEAECAVGECLLGVCWARAKVESQSGACNSDESWCNPSAAQCVPLGEDPPVDTSSGSCDDGLQNGEETDVDCGGSVCGTCGLGASCEVGNDCISGECTGDTCGANTRRIPDSFVGYSMCNLDTAGKPYCWGTNTFGALGDGSTTQRNSAVPVLTNQFFADVSAGDHHSCGITLGGQVYCWGLNQDDAINNTSTFQYLTPTLVPELVGATQIEAGELATCVIYENNELWCRGNNNYGKLGDGTTNPIPNAKKIMDDVAQVSLSDDRTCALKLDGSIWCMGDNSGGQLGDGTTLQRESPVQVLGINNAKQISLGVDHACALREGGTVTCWGMGEDGEFGDGTSPDTPRSTPGASANITDAIHVAAGSDFTCALRMDGLVWCWGLDWDGRLGNGLPDPPGPFQTEPGQVEVISDVIGLSALAQSACALLSNNEVWCWGNGELGEIGDGNQTDQESPVQVVGLSIE